MEKRSHVLCKALYMAILFVFYLNIVSAQCQDRITKHTSNKSPSQFEPPNFKNRFRRISLSILFGIITGFIFAFLFTLLVRFFIKYINRTPILKDPIVFTPQISPTTLQSALKNEPQLLGSSPNGKYYKAVLDNGLMIAVKRLEPMDEVQTREMKRHIQHEFEILSGLRHRNLMCLRTYVHESGGYSLVYDYMPNGSLGDVMKRVTENQSQLKWESRLRIAVGIVKGLHFLHFTCHPRRLHYNLKPSNVLLGSEFEPKLTDWGLAPVISNFHRVASGYNAPECFQNCRYTDKSDVYSFGVMLGFLLTGKDPLDPLFGESTSGGGLVQWLRHLQQAGSAREALDKSILGEEMEEDEMKMAVRIAVVCLSDLPADRPSSDELVSMLTQLNSF